MTLALIPLALMPEPLAWIIWTLGGLVAAIVSTRGLARVLTPGRPGVGVFVGFLLAGTRGAWATFLVGQWTFPLLAALAATVLALRAGRDRSAAISALALAVKPHLFVIALLALGWSAIRRGRMAAVLWFVALSTAVGLVSVAVFPRGWVTWLATEPAARTGETGTTTLFNAARDIGAPGLAVSLLALGAMGLIGSRFDARGDGYLAVWIVISLTAAFSANI